MQRAFNNSKKKFDVNNDEFIQNVEDISNTMNSESYSYLLRYIKKINGGDESLEKLEHCNVPEVFKTTINQVYSDELQKKVNGEHLVTVQIKWMKRIKN